MDIPIRTGIRRRELEPPAYPEFYGIVLPIFAFIGITGNIVCAVVFHAKYMRSSSTTYLTALAFADSLYLLCSCLFYSPRPITWLHTDKDPDFEYPYPELFVRSEPLIDAAEVLTIAYTLSAAVDHYIFVFKAKKYIRWTQVDSAQNIVIITLGIVLLVHIMNFFKLQVLDVDLPEISLSKVCMSAFYMQDSVQIWDKYIYFVVFGWLPLFLLLIVISCLCYKSWTWKQKDLIDQPDRFFKDGRSQTTVVAIGFLACFCLFPDLILQSVFLDDIESYDNLPICVHRAMNVSRAAFDQEWELLVVIFAVINSSVKFFLYMVTNKQFRYTVLYIVSKPFQKPVTQPPTKNMFAETLRRKLQNNSSNVNNNNSLNSFLPQSEFHPHHYHPANTSQYYHGNNQPRRPYVIAGSSVHTAPPSYSHVDDLNYYEDQYGSRKLVPPVHGTGRAQQGAPPVGERQNPPYHFRDGSSSSRPLQIQNRTEPQKSPPEEPKLKWHEDKLEPFPRRAATGAQGGVTITGGPWDDKVMEMII